MLPETFWNSTPSELQVYIDCITAKREENKHNMYTSAALIRLAVVSVFNSDVKFPDYKECFGEIAISTPEPINWEENKVYMKAIQKHRKAVIK